MSLYSYVEPEGTAVHLIKEGCCKFSQKRLLSLDHYEEQNTEAVYISAVSIWLFATLISSSSLSLSESKSELSSKTSSTACDITCNAALVKVG